MSIIQTYINGNTFVTIYSDGTKERKYEGTPKPLFPESIDIKITNYCDLGCPWCHEKSNTWGNHANLIELWQVIKDLPAGVELAIGGGNPLKNPNLLGFLKLIKEKGLIANITVNQAHVNKPEYFGSLVYLLKNDLIKGLGISIKDGEDYSNIAQLKYFTDNIVYHVICGLQKVEILDELIKFDQNYNRKSKVLVLGYKQFGRGQEFFNVEIENEIKRWNMYLPKYLDRCLTCFDNLAIEQLNLQRFFTVDGWKEFYMGDDFTFSMYIDAVEKTFAPTSRSSNRKDWNSTSLVEYFQKK